jgi:hypothetical protein
MINGISATMGREMAQMLVQQQATGSVARGDNDGDADDGGPARSGPDVDSPTSGLAQTGVKGTLFDAMA